MEEAAHHIQKIQESLESKKEHVQSQLYKAQLVLESCVETVLIGKLGNCGPLAKPLGELWTFPVNHVPLAALLTLGKHRIKVASWSVSNQIHQKSTNTATRRLIGSAKTEYQEATTPESRIIQKVKEMLQKNFDLLCLQGCWPELLEQMRDLRAYSRFEMHCGGEEQDKSREAVESTIH